MLFHMNPPNKRNLSHPVPRGQPLGSCLQLGCAAPLIPQDKYHALRRLKPNLCFEDAILYSGVWARDLGGEGEGSFRQRRLEHPETQTLNPNKISAAMRTSHRLPSRTPGWSHLGSLLHIYPLCRPFMPPIYLGSLHVKPHHILSAVLLARDRQGPQEKGIHKSIKWTLQFWGPRIPECNLLQLTFVEPRSLRAARESRDLEASLVASSSSTTFAKGLSTATFV